VLLFALTPGILLWLAIAGLGEFLSGPLKAWTDSESDLNRSLQDTRNPTMDWVTSLWSRLGNTEIIIGICVLAVALVWWRGRRWWFAVIPALAISLQSTIFVTASSVIDRPRPDVPRLDVAPPTSSYPSGHVGASVALFGSLAIMSSRIERTWLRRTATGSCCVIPVLVAYARLYRGMHHLSDVLVGAVLGLACAALASRSLTRQPENGRASTSGIPPADTGTDAGGASDTASDTASDSGLDSGGGGSPDL
jgi:undecaprenyl-diphosphatase